MLYHAYSYNTNHNQSVRGKLIDDLKGKHSNIPESTLKSKGFQCVCVCACVGGCVRACMRTCVKLSLKFSCFCLITDLDVLSRCVIFRQYICQYVLSFGREQIVYLCRSLHYLVVYV